MTRPWDEALRSLARRSKGPFRTLAYGVTERPAGEADRRLELRQELGRAGLEPDSPTVVEVASAGSSATSRLRFQKEVLEWAKEGGSGEGSPRAGRGRSDDLADAREKLRTLSAELSRFLDMGPDAGAPKAAPREAAAETRPAGRSPLVLVPRFEDLGPDAEAVAGAILAIVVRSSHVVLALEGIDTRSREGRARAAILLRAGLLRSAGARERSLRNLDERRGALEVYGPVPFGFERAGRKLVPIPAQVEAVRRARELSLRGATFFEIALALNGEMKPWKDGSSWTGRRVQLVLENPIYRQVLEEEIA